MVVHFRQSGTTDIIMCINKYPHVADTLNYLHNCHTHSKLLRSLAIFGWELWNSETRVWLSQMILYQSCALYKSTLSGHLKGVSAVWDADQRRMYDLVVFIRCNCFVGLLPPLNQVIAALHQFCRSQLIDLWARNAQSNTETGLFLLILLSFVGADIGDR